ncbi:Na/Pi cotransporter family protein [bacterium]|nr:Na/Pi cotransporter family protein [bacterium]
MEKFDIFCILQLLGGLAFFLYGIYVMSAGLEKIAGGKLEKILKTMTSSPTKGLVLGAAITAIIQSSSAVTVMLVGLVNSGIMKLSQAIGVIMGSNIGTTITAWILSLSGIQSTNVVVRMFKPESFTPILALVGVLMIFAAKSNKNKNVGSVFLGFSILMTGMIFMSTSMEPLSHSEKFINLMTLFNNPIFGVLVGTVITAIIQSSAASVGMLQALVMKVDMTYSMALPIIMGQNIGTCITAIISSVGVNSNAKKVAVVHVTFNIIGTVIFLCIFELGKLLFNIPILSQNINPAGIAILHSTFNIATTIMLFPFIKQLESIANFLVKDTKTKKEEVVFLDERLLLSPELATIEVNQKVIEMAKLVKNNVLYATKQLKNFQPRKADVINKNEQLIDLFEDKMENYLVKASNKELAQETSNAIARLLLIIGDYERIGDHAINILNIAEEKKNKEMEFPPELVEDIRTIVGAILEVVTLTTHAFSKNSNELALRIEPLEQVIDRLVLKAKNRHIKRIQYGECPIELDFLISELFNDFERISDHCSNIGASILKANDLTIDKHEFLKQLKSYDNKDFSKTYDEYKEKYSLV